MPLASVLQLISILILLVIVIVMAYFASKWIAGYQKTKGSGANIEVVETCRIAPNQYLAIVRIGSRYISVAIGKDQTSFLAEINQDDLILKSAGEAGTDSFRELLARMRDRKGNRGSE